MKVEDIKSIIYEKEDNGICTATISRPDKRNAVSVFSFLEISNHIQIQYCSIIYVKL